MPTRDRDLTLVLVIPARNAAFDDECARMGFRLTPMGGGYGRIDGGVYTLFLVITDEVSDQERDDFLRIFSHHPCQTNEAAWWWQQWRAEDLTMQDIKTMEGYEEMLQKFADSLTLEQRLAGLASERVLGTYSPEQRLAGLAPEQISSALSEEQRLLSLSDDTLRAFPDDYLRSLPAHVQDAIRKRIGRPST